MAERAPTLRVRSILTDMAWTWTRLALEAEHNSVPGRPSDGGYWARLRKG